MDETELFIEWRLIKLWWSLVTPITWSNEGNVAMATKTIVTAKD
jgi:hypothetical protein